MNKLYLAIGAALLASAPVSAQEGFYVKGGIGYGMPNTTDVDDLTADVGGEMNGEGDFRGMLGVGYDFGNKWRIDLDVMDRYSDLGAIDEVTGSGDWQNVALMGSAIYSLNEMGGVEPYVGAGIGLSKSNMTLEGILPAADVRDEDTSIALQGLAGIAVPLSQRLSADMEYRYFHNGDVSVDNATFNDLNSHDVLVGLRLAFGSPAPAPAAAPAPAPAPAPPTARAEPAPVAIDCDSESFVVYFELNSAEITDQAQAVIANTADLVGDCDPTRVTVTGHTDRSGAADYNQRLSERRARVVREGLIREGIMASMITVRASGERELAVDTPDGVREPLNRRSEVLIELEFNS